jgi:ATP-binding cassette, subfamily B, multidrug efflux pump
LKYKKLWIAGFISVALTDIFMLASPWLLKRAIDSLKEQVTMERLAIYGGSIFGVILISSVFRYFMRQTLIVASRRIEYDFRNDFFAHLLTLDRPYYDKMAVGDIMARATNDMDSVRNMVGPGIMNLSSTIIILAMALPLMISIDLKLTLLSMTTMPIISLLVLFLGHEVHKRFTKIQEQYSLMTARAQENFTGIRVVKAYVQENAEIDDFADLNVTYIERNMSMVKIWGMFFPAIALFGGVALVMVLWFGGKAVIAGTMTLGSFVAFIAYLLYLIWPMASIGWVAGMYQRGKASLVRIKEILDARPIVADKPDAVTKGISGKIKLHGLRFSYDTTEILKGIDVEIEAGANVAIIGDTGCGKSTLVSLLIRSYPVERGMITIDDVDINDYALQSLRSQVVPVMQETFLFSETIRSNIAFGNYDRDFDMISQSAVIAGMAAEIDEFPHKYDTILGERGITLSGGQKQRTALARALATDPKVLILDDAFSSVDTHTEEEILTNLRQILKGRTSIMISHRISTVKNADLILVMSDGRIVERGRHSELLTLGGRYAELYERQLIKDELEAL